MKANELRIGNLISERNGHIVEVVVISSDNTIRVRGGDGVVVGCFRTNIFKPIPLTEEWLKKFGFELIKDSKVRTLKLNFDTNVLTINEDGYCRFNGNFIPCKHVHQLQNLYFALTGEELEIK